MRAVQTFFLTLCLSSSNAFPLGQDEIPDRPPLIWHLLGGVLKGVLDPLDRGIPQDVCSTFCDLPKPVKTGLAAAACGGALLTKSWTGIVCPLSMLSWGSALDPSLCSDLCSAGQQIPRAAFDLTGVYVDPATAAAVTGLLYLLNSGKEAELYGPGRGQLWRFSNVDTDLKVNIFRKMRKFAIWCCNYWARAQEDCANKQMAFFVYFPKSPELNLENIKTNMEAFNPEKKNEICRTNYAIPYRDGGDMVHSEETLLGDMASVLNGRVRTDMFLWTLNSPCSGQYEVDGTVYYQRYTVSGQTREDRGSCLKDIFQFTAKHIYPLAPAIPAGAPTYAVSAGAAPAAGRLALNTLNVGFRDWYKPTDMPDTMYSRNTFCKKVDSERFQYIGSDGLTFTKIREEIPSSISDSAWDPDTELGSSNHC